MRACVCSFRWFLSAGFLEYCLNVVILEKPMKKTASCFALSLLFALSVQPAMAADDSKVAKFTTEQLISILKDEGYSSVKKDDDGDILIKINGKKYVLFNDSDEGDLQAYYGIKRQNLNIDYGDVNEWNRTKRFSKAYLDEEKDLALESDLMADGGINRENVTRFFSVFVLSVDAFRSFIVKRDEAKQN